MTTYTAVSNSEIDTDSPITESLMTRLRDNPIAITEGATGAPKIQNAAMAANSVGTSQLQSDCVTNAKLVSSSAGTAVISRHLGASTILGTTNASYHATGLPRWYDANSHIGWLVLVSGQVRVYHDGRHITGGGGSQIAYSRLLLNGSLQASWSEGSGVWSSRSHDLNVSVGDIILLQQYAGATTAQWRNIYLAGSAQEMAVA